MDLTNFNLFYVLPAILDSEETTKHSEKVGDCLSNLVIENWFGVLNSLGAIFLLLFVLFLSLKVIFSKKECGLVFDIIDSFKSKSYGECFFYGFITVGFICIFIGIACLVYILGNGIINFILK